MCITKSTKHKIKIKRKKELNNCCWRPEAVGKDNIGYAHTNNKENNVTSNGIGQRQKPVVQ